MPAKAKDFTGQRFGRLTILERAPNNGSAVRWYYKCDCGGKGIATSQSLLIGTSKSCGCLREERRLAVITKHGHTWKGGSTPTFNSWSNMISRCYSHTHHKYPLYGALGVTVCERWRDFANFLADMGERPPGLSIDRHPDRNGNYCPTNCRWATVTEQNNNKKTTCMVEYRGELISIGDAARLAGGIVETRVAQKRIRRGWSVERAVTTPLMLRP